MSTFQRIKHEINKAPYRDNTKNTYNKAGERDRRGESIAYISSYVARKQPEQKFNSLIKWLE